MTTLEDRRRCPKCEMPGLQAGRVVRPTDRSEIVTMTCDNSRCKWFNEAWIYQIRADGSLVEPDTRKRPKNFPELPASNSQRFLDALDQEIINSTNG